MKTIGLKNYKDLKPDSKLIITILLVYCLIVPIVFKFGGLKPCYLGFVCIAAIFLFSLILKSNTIALGLIFTTAFTQSIFSLVGLPRAIPTLLSEFCVVLLLIKALHIQLIVHTNPLKIVGILPMLGVFSVMLFSSLFNKVEILPAIFCLRQTFIFLLFFIAIQNLNLSERTISKINNYIIFLILIQLPAAVIKFIIIGQDEPWIGTISHHAGALSATFPLFIISFLVAFYYFKREKKYLILIFCFFLFGVIGHKRALVFFIPLLVTFVWYFYGKKQKSSGVIFSINQVKHALLMLLIGFAFLLMAVKMFPSFNPEGRHGGSFDLKHIIENRIIAYNLRNDVSAEKFNKNASMGRLTIVIITLKRLMNAGLIKSLIGFGPGTMIRSPHLGRSKKTPFDFFGIYGHYTGFVVYILQVGILGVLFLSGFFITLFRRIYRLYQTSTDDNFKMVALGFLGTLFVCFLDFFTYSQTTFNQQAVILPFFYIAAVLLNKYSFESDRSDKVVINPYVQVARLTKEVLLNRQKEMRVEG